MEHEEPKTSVYFSWINNLSDFLHLFRYAYLNASPMLFNIMVNSAHDNKLLIENVKLSLPLLCKRRNSLASSTIFVVMFPCSTLPVIWLTRFSSWLKLNFGALTTMFHLSRWAEFSRKVPIWLPERVLLVAKILKLAFGFIILPFSGILISPFVSNNLLNTNLVSGLQAS